MATWCFEINNAFRPVGTYVNSICLDLIFDLIHAVLLFYEGLK